MNVKRFTVTLFFTALTIPFVFFVLASCGILEDSNNMKLPMATVKTAFNGEFVKDVEQYVAQTFYMRDKLLESKTKLDILSGKEESGGVYITPTMLLEKVTEPSKETIDSYVEFINQFESTFDLPTYSLILPSSVEIYKDKLSKYTPLFSQADMITRINSKLSPEIVRLDAVTPLNLVKNEYIYFNTDRRLTSLGSYMVYNYNIKSLGFSAAKLNDFDIEHATEAFYGSLYNQTHYTGIEPDVIDLYHYSNRPLEIETKVYNGTERSVFSGLYDKKMLDTKEKGSVFLGGSKPIVDITVKNNSGKELLLFGDANAASLTQFLAVHYDRITVVDLNYMTDYYKNLIHVSDYDTVLFLNNIISLSESELLSKMNLFSE